MFLRFPEAAEAIVKEREIDMFYDGLHFLKDLPSPEGIWERVQLIGEWGECPRKVGIERLRRGLCCECRGL